MLNGWPQRIATVDGSRIHFLHVEGRGPAPLPLLLTHGYPDSFFRFHKLIPLLTDPAASGGDAADAFDVVPRGGHFPAMEEPRLLAEDIREFFRPLR